MYRNALGIMLSTIVDMNDDGFSVNTQTVESVAENRQKFLIENEQKFEQLKRDMGLKKFFYGNNFVWSRNQDNADRKAKNKGFI